MNISAALPNDPMAAFQAVWSWSPSGQVAALDCLDLLVDLCGEHVDESLEDGSLLGFEVAQGASVDDTRFTLASERVAGCAGLPMALPTFAGSIEMGDETVVIGSVAIPVRRGLEDWGR